MIVEQNKHHHADAGDAPAPGASAVPEIPALDGLVFGGPVLQVVGFCGTRLWQRLAYSVGHAEVGDCLTVGEHTDGFSWKK